jgi:IMP dehydrogenase
MSLMVQHGINGILVVNEKRFLEGILTSRDVRFRKDFNLLVGDAMTSRPKLITSDISVKPEEAIEIFAKHKIEKLPLIDKKGILRGLITASDFSKINRHQLAAKDKKGRLVVGAAIGVKDGLERADMLIKAGVDVLVIDIAHGHHKTCIDLVKALKKKYKTTDVVAGNVATADGAKDLILAGADAIKIGIGPGSMCSTRIVAGAGVPQVTAILESSSVARKYKVPVIADGGIRNSGDLAKAIAAGASTAMIGSLFSGTKESPGEYFIEGGAAVKMYRGLASRDASIDRSILEKNIERQERTPEGVSTKVSYKGEVKKIIQNLIDGLQSGMSYSGAEKIDQFWQKAKFIRVTEAGMRESRPHGLN